MDYVAESRNQLVKKLPPQNLEAEQSLLGAALTSEKSRTEITGLSEADFYDKRNGIIYDAIRNMMSVGRAIDILSVSDYLEHIGKLHIVGGIGYLANLADKTLYLNNPVEYVAMIREKSLLRKIIELNDEVTKLAYEGQETADNLLSLLANHVMSVRAGLESRDLISIMTILNETIRDLRQEDSDKLSVDSGFPGLNEMLSRLRRQTLNIVAARPGMGKSAFALNLAFNVASKGHVVAIFSLEMSNNEVCMRILSSASMIPSKELKERIEKKNMDSAKSAIDMLVGTKLFIDDSAATTPSEIRSKCKKLFSEQGSLDLVVIDYLQLMGSDGRPQNRQQEISDISRALKILAKDLNVPVIALSQLSRGVEARENKRPLLSDLRESGSIEQDADAVMFLYRESYYDLESAPKYPEEAELILAKNRAGQQGTIRMNWFPEITTFREIGNNFHGEAPPETAYDPSIQFDNDLPF